MKLSTFLLGTSIVSITGLLLFNNLIFLPQKAELTGDKPKACVMRTIFNEPQPGVDLQHLKNDFNRLKVDSAINNGLKWLLQAQAPNGGWGAGLHSKQHIINPKEVNQDPASTAMASMALLRHGQLLEGTEHSSSLKKAIQFLLNAVEQSDEKSYNITTLTGTQPQVKLGQNIDVILTSQCLSNLLSKTNDNHEWYSRIKKSIEKCVAKIQAAQEVNGATKGGSWAPVLQSAFAVNAVEIADALNIKVDSIKLSKAKEYQKFNVSLSGNTSTADAAGVMLYSVSGNARATAKEKRKVKDILKKAKAEGKIKDDKEISSKNLQDAGLSVNESEVLVTAYKLNEYSNAKSQEKEVITGFGNNGGEEFVSFLLTGESLVIGGGDEWKKWYESTSSVLTKIQEKNGSWRGHHCITSPVFCTAACLLILGIDKDLDQFEKISIK